MTEEYKQLLALPLGSRGKFWSLKLTISRRLTDAIDFVHIRLYNKDDHPTKLGVCVPWTHFQKFDFQKAATCDTTHQAEQGYFLLHQADQIVLGRADRIEYAVHLTEDQLKKIDAAYGVMRVAITRG